MLTLATILDNPGEPAQETRYRRLDELRNLGYTGLVIYPTTALSGLLGSDTLPAGDMRRWVADQYDAIDKQIRAARAAGLTVWLLYDAPSLARELVGSAMNCVRDTRTLCPGSPELLDMIGQCVESFVARFADIEGIVLRLGDNDAKRTPYLAGNDIYTPHCARCSSLGRADRLARFITFFYDLVVGKLHRKLIARAWNVRPGGMHDSPELCRRVIERLPLDNDNLILSFKFTQTDFWRFQQWNPSSLACGNRPIIYELQCQREFEGKGAVPNYQPPLWRDGLPECENSIGLAQAADKVNLAGLWAWVRGGGWGGPFISEETWIDANVYAVPQLAAKPSINLDDLARQWIDTRLDCRDPAAAAALHTTLTHSSQNILDLFYIGPYARSRPDSWYPSGNFLQDDLIDAEAAWAMIQRLPDAALDEVVAEKARAVERIAHDRRAIQQSASHLATPPGETLVHEMEYFESLAETLHHLLAGMVAFRRHQRKPDSATSATSGAGGTTSGAGGRAALEALNRCQSCWNHHQRYANFRGTATAFRSDNLWDFTQKLIDQLHK